MIEIDGAYGEGGGQVLRTSLALAALTHQPTRISRIRAGRPKPGLAPQHLTTVLALAALCNAELRGASIGSGELLFLPRTPPTAGAYTFDVAQVAGSGSAGAVTLIFQAALLPLLFGGGASQLQLSGGTHVPWSPSFDYLTNIYLPTVARMGITATCQLEAAGFYPKGGGQLRAHIPARGASLSTHPLAPLTLLERGPLQRIRCLVVVSKLRDDIVQRTIAQVQAHLSAAGLSALATQQTIDSPGAGLALLLVAEYEQALAGFVALGERGKPAETVAAEACHELLAFHRVDAPVDQHLADQLLLPMALARGRSSFYTARVTQHLLTNAHVIEQFLPVHITVTGDEDQAGTVLVEPAASEGRH